jgi:hypothetical protein
VIKVLDFRPQLESLLPSTYALLMASNLTVHPSVSRIILHGSRGLADSYRPDSDIDLSLIVDVQSRPSQISVELLQDVWQVTLKSWRASIELDLAITYDVGRCQLRCFDQTAWSESICDKGGVGCFGLYKKQKGFSGLVSDAGIQVRLMYPCLAIWRRGQA